MSKYGYIRSQIHDEQGGARQRQALLDVGVEDENIHSDQGSGMAAAASRAGWSALDARLQDGDELIVFSIDRIGRSATDVMGTVYDLLARGVRIQSITDGPIASTECR